MNIDKEILEDYEARAKSLRDSLHETETHIRFLRKQLWHKEKGINVGDIVSFLNGKEEARGMLHRLELSGSFVYPIVKLYKKDGAIGQRETRVWKSETLKLVQTIAEGL